MYQPQAQVRVREILNPEDVERFDFLSLELKNYKELEPAILIDNVNEYEKILSQNSIAIVPQLNTRPEIMLVFHKGELLG